MAEAGPEAAGVPPEGVYHLLDVGPAKFGECTLIEFGATRILIDGGHPSDLAGRQDYPGILAQLAAILGPPPHDLALLVVTHCHADHVGCLPELVERGIIRPEYALVTDPKLGFGRPKDYDARALDTSDAAVTLAAALREEGAADLDDADLAEFLDAVGRVETRYADLLDRLTRQGVKVVPYIGQPLPADLARRMAATSLTLLGPSQAQLLRCAQQIDVTNKAAKDAAAGAWDSVGSLVGLYRALVAFGAAADAGGSRNGNAMNCQSIVLAFGPPGARALLAGDMQFHEPGVTDLGDEMEMLRGAVIGAGPYRLLKTTHHTSHNGQDAAWLDALGAPPFVVHSGGARDASHPNPSVLHMLEERPGVRFARTDRNGTITARLQSTDDRALEVSRGQLNDFTPNTMRDAEAERPVLPAEAPAASSATQVSSAPAPGAVRVVIVDLPNAPIDLSVAGVEIRIRTGANAAGEGSRSGGGGPPAPQPPPLPDGPRPRPVGSLAIEVATRLDDLLFVTDPDRLRANIGRMEVDAALAAVEAREGRVLAGRSETLVEASTQALRAAPELKGVVILGGYDVAPAAPTDALGPELRDRLSAPAIENDGDHFWVWSDRLYGNKDGDHLAEVPISRIPDGRNAPLFLAALQARPFSPGEGFGARNVARPFADTVWETLPGARALEQSEAFLHTDVAAGPLAASCHYFMLHGSHWNGTEFSGEHLASRRYLTAFTARNVPKRFDGIVFSGCCWGALIVDDRAVDAVSRLPAPRAKERSIALAYLRAGALAFVGCTGAHYSGPDPADDGSYAARLHRGFFTRLAAGLPPAPALHAARNDYLAWTLANQPRMEPLDMARRFKNATQFTCLGLGW